MNDANFCFMCVSLRGSERIATSHGSRLDKVTHSEPGFAALRAWLLTHRCGEEALDKLLDSQAATGVLRRQITGTFDLYGWSPPMREVVCAVALDGVAGTFQVVQWSAWHASRDSVEGIEGDDLLFVLDLRRTVGEPTLSLRSRPATPALAVQLLRMLGVLPEGLAPGWSSRFRAGFYLVESDAGVCTGRDIGMGAELASQPENWVPALSVIAYLFRCYLICQRAERLLLAVRANGDWDEEYRKLLLVRKKIASTRKSALLNNRAAPGSALLGCFRRGLAAFRLQEQLDHLVVQAEESVRILEAQSVYIAAKRIQSIQAIVFVSTVLGLAVALNAIQMPPFYSATTMNALERPIFWVVICAVAAGGAGLWLVISSWNRIRRSSRWARGRIGGSQ